MYNLDEIIVTEEELTETLRGYFMEDWYNPINDVGSWATDDYVKDYIQYFNENVDKKDALSILSDFYMIKNGKTYPSKNVWCVYFFKIPSTDKYILLDLTKSATKKDDPHRAYLFDSILKLIPLNDDLFNRLYSTLDWYKEGRLMPQIDKKTQYIEDITFEQSVSKVYPVYSELTENILNFIKHRLQYFVIGENRWNKLDKNVQDFLISGDFNYYLIKNLHEEYITPSIIASSWASAIESLLKSTIYKKIIEDYFSESRSDYAADLIESNRKFNGKLDKQNVEKNITLGTLEYFLNYKFNSFVNFYNKHYKEQNNLKNDLDNVKDLIASITNIRNEVAHGLTKDIKTIDECYKKLYFMDGKVKALMILLIDLFI